MQFATVVHTDAFAVAVKEKLAAAFLSMQGGVVADAQRIVVLGAENSPMASGEMQGNFRMFTGLSEGTPSAESGATGEVHIKFGIAQGLHAHEVRFERGDAGRVHTEVGQHVYPNGQHCSEELVGLGGLQANPQAVKRPLAHALAAVWGEGAIPENAQTFAEGAENVVEFGTVVPAGLIDGCEEAVRRVLL